MRMSRIFQSVNLWVGDGDGVMDNGRGWSRCLEASHMEGRGLLSCECEVIIFYQCLLSSWMWGVLFIFAARNTSLTKNHQKSSDYWAVTCLMRLAAMFDCYDLIKCITKNIGRWSLSCYTLVLVFPRYVCGAFELLISRWATLGNIGQDRVMLILELRWPCGRGITSSRCLNFFTTKAGRSRGAGPAVI